MAGVTGWRFEPANVAGFPVRQVLEVERKAAVRAVVLGQGPGGDPTPVLIPFR